MSMNIFKAISYFAKQKFAEELLYSPILVNSPSNSPRKLLNYPPFCKFYTSII